MSFPKAVAFLSVGLLPSVTLAERSMSSSLKLENTNGDNGIKFEGASYYDEAGYSVSNAGDVNGDGYADLLIGAPYADPSGSSSGETYLVFGGSNVASSGLFDLSDFDGSNGFVIRGEDSYDYSGISVSGAGDVNNDGYDDMLVGAYSADPYYSSAGETYVIFGSATVGSSGYIDVEDLDGSDGFVINGDSTSDYSGWSVSGAGDFNNDGYDDILIGAYYADPNSDYSAGETYLIYGGSSVGSSGSLNVANLIGSNGFVINGDDDYDYSGYSVSGAGDFNNDGYDDIIIGAYGADANGNSAAGESYIVFGGSSVGSSGSFELSSLTGSNGFVINGDDSSDYSGYSVSGAGDFNGDGYDDVIIGAYYADPNYDTGAGESYIVYGGASVGSSGSLDLDDLDGDNGIVLEGIDSYDGSGISVSNAGDVNGDGYDDVIVGADDAEHSTSFYFFYSGYSAGESYVVFGGSSVATSGTFELADLDGSNGFRLLGEDSYDYSGRSVGGGGDFNGDGYDDVIVGAYGGGVAGEAYIIFDTSSSSSSSSASSGAIVGAIIGGLLGGICLIGLSIWACVQCCAPPKKPAQNGVGVQLQSVPVAAAAPAPTAQYANTVQPPPQTGQYENNGYNGGFQLNNGAPPAQSNEPVIVTATVVSAAPQTKGTKVADL